MGAALAPLLRFRVALVGYAPSWLRALGMAIPWGECRCQTSRLPTLPWYLTLLGVVAEVTCSLLPLVSCRQLGSWKPNGPTVSDCVIYLPLGVEAAVALRLGFDQELPSRRRVPSGGGPRI